MTSLACSPPGTPDPEATAERRAQPLLYDATKIWNHTSLSVCWENLADSSANQRQWVQASVRDAIELVSAVSFTGWGACSTAGADVVIRVDDQEWPRALVGSRSASISPSVFFNFFTDAAKDLDGDGTPDFTSCYANTPYIGLTGRRWSTQQEHCIDVIAVHEFMHVLGIEHEQERGDTPAFCDSAPADTDSVDFGYWDLTSVSNYCDPAWSNDGRLSPLDAQGIRALYGNGENTLVWLGLGNVRNYGRAPIDQINFAVWGTQLSRGLLPTSGDFDGDGKTDIFWYKPEGTDAFWWSNGDGSFTVKSRQLSAGYTPFAGDFDGDGKTDLFLYKLSGSDGIQWSNGDRTFTGKAIGGYDAGYTPVVGDFDGDGAQDIFWYAPNGTSLFWWSNRDRTFTIVPQRTDSNYAPFAGDFDGDGRTDLFMYRSSGDSWIWRANGDRTFTLTLMSVSGAYETAIGDFDGDGLDDILWIGANDALWLMRKPIGSYVPTPIVSDTGALPVSGDFNGDGLGDVVWYDVP